MNKFDRSTISFEIPDWFTSNNSANEADTNIKNAIERFLCSCTNNEYLNQARLVLNFETLNAASPSYLYMLYQLTKLKMPLLQPMTDQEAQFGLHDYFSKLLFPILCWKKLETRYSDKSRNSVAFEESKDETVCNLSLRTSLMSTGAKTLKFAKGPSTLGDENFTRRKNEAKQDNSVDGSFE